MTLTLRARLAVISTLVFGVLLAGLGVASYQVLARRLDADLRTRLTELTDGLHGYLRFNGNEPSVEYDVRDSDQAAFVHEATRYFQIYDANTGRLLVQSNGFAPLGLNLTPVEVHALRAQPRPFDIRTEYGRIRISNSVITRSPERVYLLQVGVPLEPMDAALRRYFDLLLWSVPLAILLSVLSAWWFSALALAPLSRVAAAAREIDVKTLDRRLPTRAVDDELNHVVRAFNETLARLQHSVADMRQFSAALAHELRTPLAVLRGEIELGLSRSPIDDRGRRAAASQIEEIDKLNRLIDHILTLARAESGQIRLTFAPVDVGDLAASLVEQLETVAESRTIDLRCERANRVVVSADAGWLERLLLNLLDNALKFTKEGGHVLLRVSREGDRARIDVKDTGIGMSRDVSEHAFERFFRADFARSSATAGAGLGLSLVRWIVDRHHGTIAVDSRLGEGSTFTITLPMAPVHP